MSKIQNDLFLRACKRQPVEHTPVWIMRQAGRYLPEYRKVRASSDFLSMCKTPELAAEVTLQPVDIIGVDAAILFSDILVIPEAMGMHLEMNEGKGPVFPKPLRSQKDVEELKIITPEKELKFVLDAVSLVKKELNNRVPLIGFCGSPFTLMTYMVEGKGSKNYSYVKGLMYNEPATAHLLLNKLADACSEYLSAKIEAGCNAVQIFDTWGGILNYEDYLEFSLPYIQKIISNLKKKDEPVIIFAKGVHYCLKELANSAADVIGLDWTMNLSAAREIAGNKVALQGNLDPAKLYGGTDYIRNEVKKVLGQYGNGSGHIFNLGHGILPDIEPYKAKELVKYVHEESVVFHKEV